MDRETGPTTLRQLTYIALRLIGIYVVAQAMFFLPHVVQIMISGSFDADNLPFFLGGVLTVAFGVVLWVIAGPLSVALVGRSDARATAEASAPLIELEVIAYSLLGVFLLVHTLPSLVTSIAELIAPDTFGSFSSIESSEYFGRAKALEVVADVVRLAIAIWLVIGSRGLARRIRRLREGARSTQFDEDEIENSEN